MRHERIVGFQALLIGSFIPLGNGPVQLFALVKQQQLVRYLMRNGVLKAVCDRWTRPVDLDQSGLQSGAKTP
jgi:hypothetical protein